MDVFELDESDGASDDPLSIQLSSDDIDLDEFFDGGV